MSRKAAYEAVTSGKRDNNIRSGDLVSLLLSMGFTERIKGSHHIYTMKGIPEKIVLQPEGNKAKPYQVKQVREIIQKYDMEVR